MSDMRGWRAALKHPSAMALLIATIALATIGLAWMFQIMGHTPCELCLKERIPYYVGIPVAVVTAVAALRSGSLGVAGHAVLIVTFVVGAALGLYHAGVEWHFWAGPSQCSGAVTAAPKVVDFLQQLNHVAVTRCDEVSMRVFGLSLAVWNVIISIGLIGLANLGLLRCIAVRAAR